MYMLTKHINIFA